MADLGSQDAIKADIDAKVTTNGANENTGARVNTNLNNIVDTLYGAVGKTAQLGYWNHAANSNAGNCTIAADGFELNSSNSNGEAHSTYFGNLAGLRVQVLIRQEGSNAYRLLTGTVTSALGKLTGASMTVQAENGVFAQGNPTAFSIALDLQVEGKLLYVDSVVGSDTTGVRQRPDRPFLTLTAAKTAAQSGDTIIVRPGTYDERNLLKNGVNWHFEAGAEVVFTTDEEGWIFTDNGLAVTCSITGHGRFVWTPDVASADEHFGVLNTAHASSVVTVQCKSIEQLGDNFQFGWTVLQEDGVITVHCTDKIVSPGGAYNLGWFGGTAYINAPNISQVGNCVTWTGDATGGNWFVTCEEMISSGADLMITYESVNTDSALWIMAKLIKGDLGVGLVSGASGKVYINAQKIWNTNAVAPVIKPSGGRLWVTAQKITANSGVFYAMDGGTPDVKIEAQEYESLLVGADTSGYGSIYNDGATLTLIGGTMVLTNAGETVKAITHASGKTRMQGLVVDLGGNDDPASAPLTLGGAGCILDHSTLIAPTGNDSVAAGAAQNLVSYASYTNEAVNANVTVQGDLTVGAYVV